MGSSQATLCTCWTSSAKTHTWLTWTIFKSSTREASSSLKSFRHKSSLNKILSRSELSRIELQFLKMTMNSICKTLWPICQAPLEWRKQSLQTLVAHPQKCFLSDKKEECKGLAAMVSSIISTRLATSSHLCILSSRVKCMILVANRKSHREPIPKSRRSRKLGTTLSGEWATLALLVRTPGLGPRLMTRFSKNLTVLMQMELSKTGTTINRSQIRTVKRRSMRNWLLK